MELFYSFEELSRDSNAAKLSNKDFMIDPVKGFRTVLADDVDLRAVVQVLNDIVNMITELWQTASPVSKTSNVSDCRDTNVTIGYML